MVWDHGVHHLQVEVHDDGHYDWFYRHRTTGRLESQDNLPIDDTRTLRARLLKNLKA